MYMRFIRTSIFEHDTQSQTNIATYEIAFAEMNKSHSVLETAMQIERMKAGRTAVDVNGICTELDAVDVVNALNEAGEEHNTLLWGDTDEHIRLETRCFHGDAQVITKLNICIIRFVQQLTLLVHTRRILLAPQG
jgi:hypothetical protein